MRWGEVGGERYQREGWGLGKLEVVFRCGGVAATIAMQHPTFKPPTDEGGERLQAAPAAVLRGAASEIKTRRSWQPQREKSVGIRRVLKKHLTQSGKPERSSKDSVGAQTVARRRGGTPIPLRMETAAHGTISCFTRTYTLS